MYLYMSFNMYPVDFPLNQSIDYWHVLPRHEYHLARNSEKRWAPGLGRGNTPRPAGDSDSNEGDSNVINRSIMVDNG